MFVRGDKIRMAARVAIVSVALLAGACAGRTDAPAASSPTGIYDPFEPVNRTVFGFNNMVDTFIFRPVAVAYRNVVPSPIRMGVTNFLRHLRTPIIFANEVLQGDWEGAEVAATRFFVNTIAGMGGFLDIQGMSKGYEYRHEDFGQTMAVWGVGSGPYLVIPLFGPTTLRDGTGAVVDSLADPFNQLANANDVEEFFIARLLISALDARERNIENIDELKQSIDYYAAVRSAYLQQRNALIRDGRVDPDSDFPSLDELDLDDEAWLNDAAPNSVAEFQLELPPIGTTDDNSGTDAGQRPAPVGLD